MKFRAAKFALATVFDRKLEKSAEHVLGPAFADPGHVRIT